MVPAAGGDGALAIPSPGISPIRMPEWWRAVLALFGTPELVEGHAFLSEWLERGSVGDGLNRGDVEIFESISRRWPLIEPHYSETLRNPAPGPDGDEQHVDGEEKGLFLDQRQSLGGALISPVLLEHGPSEPSSRSAVDKERREAREARSQRGPTKNNDAGRDKSKDKSAKKEDDV